MGCFTVYSRTHAEPTIDHALERADIVNTIEGCLNIAIL